MRVAIYLFPNQLGHLNPTTNLSKNLVANGWDVVYCGSRRMMTFTVKMQFKLYPMVTTPFLHPDAEIETFSGIKKWFLQLRRRWSNIKFEERRIELVRLISKLKPEIIFLDSFFYSDFILIHSINPNIRCIFLDVRFPSYRNSQRVPPGNIYAFPGEQCSKLWRRAMLGRYIRSFYHKLIYLGKNNDRLLSDKAKSLGVPGQYSIIKEKLYSPAYRNVEEWYLFPEEMDFPGQKLFSWQQYVPLGIDQHRSEIIPPDLEAFLALKNKHVNSRLIYLSLGTLPDSHIRRASSRVDLDLFYQKLIDISRQQTNWFFVITASTARISILKNVPQNVYLANYIPQLYILTSANLMINHGGGSINEAAYSGVPMLVFPINGHWDFNGNAARVVFHGLGLAGSLNDPVTKIRAAIATILDDEEFAKRARMKSRTINTSVNNFDIKQWLYPSNRQKIFRSLRPS